MAMLTAGLESKAVWFVALMQDWLNLDGSARMNEPGKALATNWRWRMNTDMLTKEAQKELLEVTRRYGRFNWLTKK